MPTYQFPTIYERLPYERPPYESPTHERPTRYPDPIIYRPPTRSICDVPLEFGKYPYSKPPVLLLSTNHYPPPAEYGQRVHNVVYLERRHRDPYFLSIAAAFETLHRWEHNRRREGQLLNHDSAKVWLEASVVHEAKSLFVAAEGHPRERLRMLRFAKLQVIDLYEYQYSEYRCYDPNTQNPHWTMAKEWREPKVE